ncbi:DUF2829 domain-containing protein [Pontibacterium sp.]|uniref:DUF2829 domain-containing protein n=1 Tax=Pontibacterium sp. TaxID=2036026 RepID=UPI003567872B
MDFGQAIKEMRIGKKVQRVGWNGKGMFLFHVSGNSWDFTTDVSGVDDLDTESFICMKTAGDTLIPWLASQADMQAEDWQVVGE